MSRAGASQGEVEEPAGLDLADSVSPCDARSARDLGPDVGPHRDVVVQERPGIGVVDELAVVLEQLVGEVVGAEALEVHREERDVGEDVAVTQPVVELEAVEDARPVVEQEDVVGEQVPVAVADAALRDAGVEERGAPVDVPLGPGLDLRPRSSRSRSVSSSGAISRNPSAPPLG